MEDTNWTNVLAFLKEQNMSSHEKMIEGQCIESVQDLIDMLESEQGYKDFKEDYNYFTEIDHDDKFYAGLLNSAKQFQYTRCASYSQI